MRITVIEMRRRYAQEFSAGREECHEWFCSLITSLIIRGQGGKRAEAHLFVQVCYLWIRVKAAKSWKLLLMVRHTPIIKVPVSPASSK